MNQYKNSDNTGENRNQWSTRIGNLLSGAQKLALRFFQWLRKEIVIVVGAILIVVITLTVTQATPQSRWMAGASDNCLTQGQGFTMVENNGLVYILNGGGTNTFRSYDPSTGNCTAALATFPTSASSGAKLIRIDDDTLYAIPGGNNSSSFYYHIRDNFWSFYNRSHADSSALPPPTEAQPTTQGPGNSITAYNGEIYSLAGLGTYFHKYSPATNSWTTLSSVLGTISHGGALTYPGSGNYLYALQGNNSSTNNFYRYDLIGNSWSYLQATPGPVNAGGALTTVNGTDIYAFAGGGTKNFWKYSISSNTWTNLTSTYPLPDYVYGGGAMTSIGAKIYAMPGNMTDYFWELDTSAGSPVWVARASLPQPVYSGGALTTDGTYVYASKGMTTGYLYRYDPTVDSWETLEKAHTGLGSNAYNEARGGLAYLAVGPGGGPEIFASTGSGTTSSCTFSCSDSLMRYTIGNNSWPVYLSPPTNPAASTYGSSVVYSSLTDSVYYLRGGAGYSFWKFLVSRNFFLTSSIGKFDNLREISLIFPLLSSATQGQGSSVTAANGKLYHLAGNSSSVFLEYDPANNLWQQLPKPPLTVGVGGSIGIYDDETLFVTSGSYFWKYHIPTKTWFNINIGKTASGEPVSQILESNESFSSQLNQLNGSHLVEKNGEFFMHVGGGTNRFLNYNPTLNRWAVLPTPAGAPSIGSASVVAGDYIFTLRGGNNANFYRFDTTTSSWSSLTSLPATAYYGASIAYPGGDFLYALRGNYTNSFYRYCFQNTGSGCAVDSWSTLSTTAPHIIAYGGAMTAYNSTTLYALGGNGTKNFMRFDITNSPSQGDGTWTDLTTIDTPPAEINYGGSLTTDGTYIYATVGNASSTFLRYDPSAPAGSRWTALPNAPVNFTFSGSLSYSSTLGEIFASPGNGYGGFNQNSGNGPSLLFRYQLPASSANPADDNTWIYFSPPPRPPSSFGDGASVTRPAGNNYLFALKGLITSEFWTFDVTNNVWRHLRQSLLDDGSPLSQDITSQTQGIGNSLVEVNGSVYMFNGGTSSSTYYNFQKYDPASNTWTALTNVPTQVGAGAALAKLDNDNLYAFTGNATSNFFRYHIPSNAWINFNQSYAANGKVFSQTGPTQNIGNSIVKANDPITGTPIFFIAPGNSTSFYRYNPADNTWTLLSALPVTPTYGAAFVAAGNYIYYSYGQSSAFYRYDIVDNVWSSALASAPGSMRGGSNLAYPGSGDYIYALRGYDQNSLYRFCIPSSPSCPSSPTGQWSTMTNAPAITDTGNALAFLNSNDLYALGGNNTKNFWKYDVGLNSWDTLALDQPPFLTTGVNAGGSLVSDGVYIYASPGNGAAVKEFWRYNPAASSGSRWTRFTSTTLGFTGDMPAVMGTNSTTQNRGSMVLCDNCAGTGLKEIWATTGLGVTGNPTSSNDNAGLIHRFRIDPVTCDGSGLNPGTGINPCTNYNAWTYYPKPAFPSVTINHGGSLTYPGSGPLLYAFAGTNTTTFLGYNMSTNTWSTLTAAPAAVGYGGALASFTSGNPLIYGLRGNGSSDLVLFTVTNPNNGTGTWSTVSSGFGPVRAGGSLVYDGSGNLYASAGSGTGTIGRFPLPSGPWSTLSPLGASLTLPSPLAIGNTTTTDSRGGLVYLSSGPSGGPELFASTGLGAAGRSFTFSPGWGLIYRYPLTSGSYVGTWPVSNVAPAQAPATVGMGAALASTDSDSIFTFRGYPSTPSSLFWRYDVSADSWSNPALAPYSPYSGTTLLSTDSSTLYATFGLYGPNGGKGFSKYTISDPATGAGSWSDMAALPVSPGFGSSAAGGLAYTANLPQPGDQTIWMVPGAGQTSNLTGAYGQMLYRYDINTNSWPYYASVTMPGTSTTFSSGSDLTLSSDQSQIFAIRGTEATVTFGSATWSVANPNFWRYTIATDTWTARTNVFNNTLPKRVYSGGSVTSTNLDSDKIYVATGGATPDILVYSISGNSWTAPGNLLFPFPIGLSTSGTDGGELIYSPSTERLIGATATDTTAPYSIYYADLANRAVPTLESALASTETPFNIRVTATDLNDNPINVTQDTSITLSLKSGGGNLGGNLSGVIPNGQNFVIISGVTYDEISSGITLTATDTSAGPTLMPFDLTLQVYGASPTVSDISPDSGSTGGGLWITITGNNFVDGTYVTFNDITATDIEVISDSELRVLTPAISTASLPDAVDVSVFAPSGQTTTAAAGFTYTNLTVTSITPDSGSMSGGSVVTITGTNFGPANYRREITLTNSGPALSDIPVSFTIDTSAIIAAGKMRPDCGDIRVQYTDQSEPLPYWIEDNSCNTSATRIWTKVPSLPNGNTVINMTYGNKLLTPASNGDEVFLFFDDFEDGSLDTSKWTISAGSPVIYDGKLVLTYYQPTTQSYEGIFAGSFPIPANTVWETSADPGTVNRIGNVLKGAANTTAAWNSDSALDVVSIIWSSSYVYAETLTGNTSMGLFTTGFKPYKIVFRPNDENRAYFYYNNGAATTINGADSGERLYPTLFVSSGSHQAQWEYFFIRPYAGSSEPGFSVGAETGDSLKVQFSYTTTPWAEDVEFINDTTIRAVTPVAEGYTYDVIVYNADGRTATLDDAFTFGSASLNGVDPEIGTTAGGSSISVTGSNLSEGGYRRPVFISNSSGTTLTDQTLFFTLDTASLISGAKMQSACQDIRVKDDDHASLLSHWVESCNISESRVWVTVPSVPPEGKYIYVHYGNPNYASSAAPENLFAPLAETASIAMWLKSDLGYLTTVGNNVSQWSDASGNGNHVTQATSGNQPVYNSTTHNGLRAISFDGSNDYLARTGFSGLPTGTSNRSVFMVNRYDKAGVGGFTYGNNATNAAFGLVNSTSTSYGYLGVQGYGTDYFSTSAALYQGILLQEAILNSGALTQLRNGTSILSSPTTTLNTASTKIEIGREIDTTPYLDMDLFEVIVFNKALSTEERLAVENYFTLKYDLNNNIITSTYTGAEEGQADTFNLYLMDSFGSDAFANITFAGNNTITAITPAHGPETVDISYESPGLAGDADLLDSYTFADPPTIISIFPATGTNTEILTVDVEGTEITSLTQISLSKTGEENIDCTNYRNITSTTLTCDLDLRNQSLGSWDVGIFTPDITPGDDSNLAGGFSITQGPPEITFFNPQGGSTLGGTDVTITGNYFVRKAGNYTTPVTINNSGTVQNNYQVRFTLDTATAIANSKMRSDCGDLRVYADSNYSTSIPYFIESGCNSASTVIWAKVPTLAASSITTIYANYGRPDFTSASDGDDVFLFFDDFEGGSIDTDKWETGGNVNWIIESAERYLGIYSSKNGDIGGSQNSYLASKSNNSLISVPAGAVAIIDFYWQVSSESNYDYLYYCKSDDDSTLPSCTRLSGYINRIAGTVAWVREQSTGTTLAAGLHRIKFAYEKDGSGDVGSDTGWIDYVKVRLYSASVADGVAGTETTEQNSPTVLFDTTPATAVVYVDSNTLEVISPAHAAGPIQITVTNPDLQSDTSDIVYTYSAPPSLTSIDPDNGLTTDPALTVTIYGNNLVATPTAKLTNTYFPDITCTNPRNFVDGTPDSFQCDLDLTGKHFGDWDVVVQNPDQQVATLGDGFAIFNPAPTLISIDPTSGPSSGGTPVEVTGSGFLPGDAFVVEYPVSYSGSDLYNYQVLLQFNSNGPVFGGDLREDCADIRLFDSDSVSPLDFYLANPSACGSGDPLNIWVEIPVIAEGGKSIYLKYGDPTWTTSASDAASTFVSVIPNPLAEWKMDELAGSIVEDSAPANNDGAATGTTIVDGKFGKARRFQGDPDYINFGVKSALNPSGSEAEHTMEAWIKLDISQGSSYPTLFNLWEENGSYDKSYLVDFPSQGVRYYVRNAANSLERVLSTGNLSLYDNNWHHLVVTNDRSGGLNYLRIYLDGTLRNTSSGENYGMRSVLPAINLQMAKQTWSGFQGLWGSVDEARIYSRALTEAEVSALYNNYGFFDENSSSILVTRTSPTPPSVEAPEAATLEPPLLTFDGERATDIVLINSTTLEAVTPPGTGTVDVTLTNPDSQSDTLTAEYTYTPPPTISDIVPDTGHNQESLVNVVISGQDFLDTPTVELYKEGGLINCDNVTFVSSTSISCDLDLTGASVGLYNVRVTNPDTQEDVLADGFEVTFPQPTITGIDPSSGHISGGETITITGTYFEDGAEVDFDDVYSPDVIFISAGELEVLTPAHSLGLKDVTVTNPNEMSVTAVEGFEFIDPPVPTGIVPASGSNDLTSYTVTISGSNFIAPLSAKLARTGQSDIDCDNVRNFVDNSPPTDDSFQCDLNLLNAEGGFWNIVVINGNSQEGTLTDGFEITFAPPTVSAVTPDEVATGTTQSVTISGTNFYSEDPDFISVSVGGTGGIGGSECTSPVVVSQTSLTCNLPPLAAGTYDVTVTTGAGTDTAEDLITYFDPPTVTDITPDSGLTSGGTAVTITGTNFYGTPTVYMTHTPFEETTATDVIVVNPTTITAVTPASTEGPVDVKVVTGAGDDTLEDGYTYFPPPADPDASTIEIFAYVIEQINSTYYQDSNLSPVHASLIRVRAIESITGNLIIGREVNLEPDPADDLLIRSTSCDNIYDIGATEIATTDSWGTACFLVWSTADPSFDTSLSEIGATIAAGSSSNPVTLTDTVTLEIEPMAMTSILNYRFRNDDGNELTATPLADTSTPYYRALNALPFRLRLGITRFLANASEFARYDEFTLSGRTETGPRPLPAPSPEGISSFRAFPGYAIDENSSTLYLATPNRADSKARIYRHNLTDLTVPATYFEFPATVNFTPPTTDDIDAPIDGGTHLITRMFIDSDNDLMYFVLTPYFDDSGLTRVYKVDLLTGTVIDVYADTPYSAKSCLDAEIDLDNGFLYLAVGPTVIPSDAILFPAVQKISLNGRNEAMTMVGELQLEGGSTWATSSVIDLTNQFLYVTAGSPQKIFKVDLNVDPSLPPVKVDEIALVPIDSSSPFEKVGIQAAIIDTVEGYAYFAGSSDFTAPDYQFDDQAAFITKVDVDPTRTFEVASRLDIAPPNPASDNDLLVDYAYLPPNIGTARPYGYASLDQTNGYGYFPLARYNVVRDQLVWKLIRVHLDFSSDVSLYDELLFPQSDSTSIKGSTFFPQLGRGYLVREKDDGDWLYEFNSTSRQNFKLQSSPNVDPEYCNYASNELYTWSDIPNADFELVDSPNLTDGDPTSNVTGLLYDNNTYFRAGEVRDGSATTSRISLGQNEFTEIEYSLAPTVNAQGSYCLRLIDADPLHQNQVSGHPNPLFNIITPQFEADDYHHYVPITINGVELEKNEINVVEGSTSDSYGIRLTSEPTGDVTITVTANDDRLILFPDITPLTPQETSLTFDDGNWDSWQYVSASALDNGLIDGTSLDLIAHTAASADPGYDNIIIEPVQSVVTDYGASISNVLTTVSGTITFTPPADFSFPDVNTGVNTPNFSPTLSIGIQEGRGSAYDFVMTLQTDGFCRTQTICLPLDKIFVATSGLINSFNTFNAAQIGQFMANYLQDGESLTDRATYVHADPGEDRPLNNPVTLFDSRNVPSGNSGNPLQGTIDFGLNLMIDFANISGLTSGNYRTLLTIDLNTNPL